MGHGQVRRVEAGNEKYYVRKHVLEKQQHDNRVQNWKRSPSRNTTYELQNDEWVGKFLRNLHS